METERMSRSPGLAAEEDRHQLGRLVISRDEAEKLRRICAATGALAAWHRRKALALYLDTFNDDGTPRYLGGPG